jgi:hypothetical protein
MPLNAIPALFGCEACCWKTAYMRMVATCAYGRCVPGVVTLGGCLAGTYSGPRWAALGVVLRQEAGTADCTACEAGEEQCCSRSVSSGVQCVMASSR